MSGAPTIAKRRMEQRARQRHGADAEVVVRARLISAGFAMVERIETGHRRCGMRWVPCARVAGDFRAVGAGGQSVLVEVKARPHRLPYSAIETHQSVALSLHALVGGLSLLAWVGADGIALMDWTTVRLVPGDSLSWADAVALCITRTRKALGVKP